MLAQVLSVLSACLAVPVVRAVPTVVVITMAAEAFDLPVATASYMLPD